MSESHEPRPPKQPPLPPFVGGATAGQPVGGSGHCPAERAGPAHFDPSDETPTGGATIPPVQAGGSASFGLPEPEASSPATPTPPENEPAAETPMAIVDAFVFATPPEAETGRAELEEEGREGQPSDDASSGPRRVELPVGAESAPPAEQRPASPVERAESLDAAIEALWMGTDEDVAPAAGQRENTHDVQSLSPRIVETSQSTDHVISEMTSEMALGAPSMDTAAGEAFERAEYRSAGGMPPYPPQFAAMYAREQPGDWSDLNAAQETWRPGAVALATTLETLASRIRAGELRVRGYEPGLGEPAALAAALAALLGVRD
jgi:hypothetical protein